MIFPTSTMRTISSVSASVTRRPSLELRLLADAAKHRVDLRAAAVDEHAAHADAAQQKHVLRERKVGLAVDRRAAELHDDRLAGELADVGQRLDEDARGLGGGRLMTSCYSL